jgi:hypothetical protein
VAPEIAEYIVCVQFEDLVAGCRRQTVNERWTIEKVEVDTSRTHVSNKNWISSNVAVSSLFAMSDCAASTGSGFVVETNG